uniref:Receptor expression-enhancing protein n=1 Tax=Meloidogyne enterolobii TaxID=390850 RepID=A0A6V7WY11_MELEN|nr:unnamed protein product [Meloidogyne enterolobii]
MADPSQPPAADAPPPATARTFSVAPKRGARAVPSSSSGARLSVRETEIKSLTDVRPAVIKWLLSQDHLFNELEKISGLDREKLFYIFCGFFSVYMIAGPGCGVVCNLIGFGYPAYCSVKAIRTDTKDDDTQWLIYWTTFAAFSIVDFFAESIYKWFPLYWLAKIIFLLYLALPQTQGAHNLYVQYVDPLFDKMNMIAKEQMKG